jgi:hypothetical protein
MHLRSYPIFIVVVVGGMTIAIAQFENDKSKLRRQVAQLGQTERNLVHLHTESAHSRAVVAQFETSSEDGAKAIHADLIRAQVELAALEAKADRSQADASAAPSIGASRDPTKAMTKLEFLTDAGRATPAAAFQTFTWAALKGRELEMSACVSLESGAREKAETLLAALSAETRDKYGTPEQLVALFLAHSMLEATAYQVVGSSTADDGDHTTLTVRIRTNGREHETQIPMVRSADAWSVTVSEKQIDAIRNGLKTNPSKP